MKPDIFIKNLLLAIAFYVGLFFAFFLFLRFSDQINLLSEKSFLNWDAQHYLSIKENNYQGINVAFFPLFPFFWKLVNVSPVVISFLNGLIYISAFSILSAVLGLTDRRYFFLSLSFPSLIFMFLPYSEAVFYMASSLLLIGFYKKNNWAILTGFLLCSLSRPVASIFVPAIVITEFLTSSEKKKFLSESIIYIVVIVCGLLLSMLIQYYYTNEWFSFFEAQKKWGNYFRFPDMPLNTWGGDNILRLDGSAMLVGFLSLIAVLIWLMMKIKHETIQPSKAIVFSTLYLTGISMFVLFFRGGWMFSLNRFVFATPFFVVCFFYFIEQIKVNTKKAWLSFLFISIYWLLCGSYVHIQAVLKYEALTIYLLLFMFISSKNKIVSNVAFVTCLAGNIFLLLFFYYRFLSGNWVA